MYICLYNFLEIAIHDLQFGFQQKYSTSYAFNISKWQNKKAARVISQPIFTRAPVHHSPPLSLCYSFQFSHTGHNDNFINSFTSKSVSSAKSKIFLLKEFFQRKVLSNFIDAILVIFPFILHLKSKFEIWEISINPCNIKLLCRQMPI